HCVQPARPGGGADGVCAGVVACRRGRDRDPEPADRGGGDGEGSRGAAVTVRGRRLEAARRAGGDGGCRLADNHFRYGGWGGGRCWRGSRLGPGGGGGG